MGKLGQVSENVNKMSSFKQTKIIKMWHLEALEAKSEFNLGFGSAHRSFWTMTQLCGFETRKFDSSTKSTSGRALEAPWDQTNIGMTCYDIKVTLKNTKLGEARFGLGAYSLVMLAKHVKNKWRLCCCTLTFWILHFKM